MSQSKESRTIKAKRLLSNDNKHKQDHKKTKKEDFKSAYAIREPYVRKKLRRH